MVRERTGKQEDPETREHLALITVAVTMVAAEMVEMVVMVETAAEAEMVPMDLRQGFAQSTEVLQQFLRLPLLFLPEKSLLNINKVALILKSLSLRHLAAMLSQT